MSQYYPQRQRSIPQVQASSGVVAKFMNGVYAWMCLGLCVTGLIALAVSRAEMYPSRGLVIILFLAELGLVVAISGAVNRISASVATGLFLLYAALNGVTLSFIFAIYDKGSIAGAFMVTAGMFGAMSLYGMTTKRDLTGIGSFMVMALIGLIIASIVNIFFFSSTLYWIITYAGVVIFVALTAYDTQKLKQMAYDTSGNEQAAARMAIVGSLALYLDFINLLLFILRIMGSRRSS